MDYHEHLPAKAPARSGNGSPRDCSTEALAILTACLALVRPVGMTADEVEDWLAVALGEVRELPIGILREAASEARKTANHYAQIIPAISKAAVPLLGRIQSFEIAAAPVEQISLPRPRLSDAEFQEIVADRGRALSVNIEIGRIISNGDGTFRLPT